VLLGIKGRLIEPVVKTCRPSWDGTSFLYCTFYQPSVLYRTLQIRNSTTDYCYLSKQMFQKQN